MMDLSPLTQAILVYAALAVGVVMTLLTGFAQLRELPAAWQGKPSAALVRRGFLAASVGMGSIGGSVLALELGGPGAIGWMWIASLLGMGVIYAEVQLSLRLRKQGRADSAQALVAGLPKGLGRPLALLFTLALMIFALAAGSLLQTQQSSELLATVGGDRWMVAVFLVATAAVGMAVPKLRAFVAALGPVAVFLYVFAVLLIIVRAPGDAGAAFASILSGIGGGSGNAIAGGAAGGGVLMAMQAGFLRATLATEAGLGSVGFTPEADTVKDPNAAAASAMLAPLVSGILVPTVTALAVLTASPWVGQRLDEAGERRAMATQREASEAELQEIADALASGEVAALRDEDKLRTAAAWLPLELPQARGTAGSLQAGQTVVLPQDAVVNPDDPNTAPGLESDYVYPMVMRASPRGVKLEVKEGQKSMVLRAAEETEVIRELVFRDRDPSRNPYPAYDVRVELENERFGPEGQQLVRLTPKDSSVDLYRLSKVRDGPYLVYGDFYFEGRVVRMFHNDWGAHHAIVAATAEPGRPLSLRTAVSSGAFRGPYFDNGEPRPPTAMIGRAGFDAPIGSRLQLEYQSPSRGMDVGQLLTNGVLVTPPWRFLADTKVAVLRHKEDPSKDLRIPVDHELVDGTLRFVSARPDIADFAKADRFRDYTGPYLDPPSYRFEVEVHGGARAPASSDYLARVGLERSSWTSPFADRRTLVAVHPYDEAQGSRRELYDPHPSEVAPFMDGPWVSGSGIERLGWASKFARSHGGDLLLAISVLILALTTMIAWSSYGARAADFALGHGAGLGFRVLFVLVGLAGAVLTAMPILRLADHAMLALIVLHGLGLVLATLRLRKPA